MAIVDAEGSPTGDGQAGRPPAGADRRPCAGPSSPSPSTSPGCRAAAPASAPRRCAGSCRSPSADYPRSGADWYLVHLTALLGEAALLDEVCAEYRVHGGNAYELDRDETRPRPRPRIDRLRRRDHRARWNALADELGLERPRPILSFSDLANRLVSLQAGARRATRSPGDRPRRSAARRAARRPAPLRRLRGDEGAASSPGSRWRRWRRAGLARRLAELFLFPERRTALNRLLGAPTRDGWRPDGSAEMRILIATDHYPPFIGGAHRQARLLAAGMAERGHDVAVVTPWHGGLPRARLGRARHRPPAAADADRVAAR